MDSFRKSVSRLWSWFVSTPPRCELGAWFLCFGFIYLVWALVLRPIALDFNIYRFAGYAYQEGISAYASSPAAFALAEQHHLSPFAPRYLYSPVIAWLMSVLILLPYPVLRALFTLAAVAVLFSSIYLWSRGGGQNGVPRFLLGATFLYLPIFNNLAAGQVNLFLLGLVIAVTYLTGGVHRSGNASSRRADGIAGFLFGLSIIVKPVLWPLGVWAIFRRKFALLVGALVTIVAIVSVSVLLSGLAPWLDYINILRSFTSPDRYVENQSVVGIVARFEGATLAQSIQILSPILVLAGWFVFFRGLPYTYELPALTAVSVLISPLAWYYYFVLLIPAFWLLAGEYAENPKWFNVLLVAAYGLIQLHGLVWHYFPEKSLFANLAFIGLVILNVLLFHRAHKPSPSRTRATDQGVEIAARAS